MSKILELADAYARETYPALITEARAALAAEVEKLQAESNEMALIGVRTVADVLALGAEIENYRQQLRKEQLYVRALHTELEAARKDAARYRWLRDKGDDTWVPLKTRWLDGMYTDKAEAHIDTAIAAMESTK